MDLLLIKPVRFSKVKNEIEKLKNKKARGYDAIDATAVNMLTKKCLLYILVFSTQFYG